MALSFLLKLKPFSTKKSSKVPLKTLLKELHFLLATCACGLSFGLMTLVMSARPFSLALNKSVLAAHFVAMVVPSLFLAFGKRLSPMHLVVSGMLCYVGRASLRFVVPVLLVKE